MEFEGEDGFSNSKFVMICVVRGKIDFCGYQSIRLDEFAKSV